MIQCDKMIKHKKPAIVLVDKEHQKCLIIDVACPGDNRVAEKEEEKLLKNNLQKSLNILQLLKCRILPIATLLLGNWFKAV